MGKSFESFQVFSAIINPRSSKTLKMILQKAIQNRTVISTIDLTIVFVRAFGINRGSIPMHYIKIILLTLTDQFINAYACQNIWEFCIWY